MLENKSDFIKTSVFYLLKLMFILFVNPYLCAFASLAVFMAIPGISSTVYVNLVNGILGIIIELLLLFLLFLPEFYNDKKSEAKSALLCFGTALVLQLIIASINHFYPYTAGMSVTYIGNFGYIQSTGNIPKTPDEVPAYYYLILTLLTNILRIASVFYALLVAKKKQLKEKSEILGNTRNKNQTS